MELEEKQLSSERSYTGPVFTVTRDEILLPDGTKGRRDLVHSTGGVVILPLDGEGNVTLVRQFRYAHGRVLLEAVAGKLEKGEEPFPAAQRELKEETGFTAARWDFLGAIETSPGFLTEKLYLYLARGLSKGEMDLDEGEFLEPVRYGLEEAAAMAADGRISDAKTLAVLLRARHLLKGEI
ncbi:MAG: NUDIX hydrolase [Oscillospiraceae bacterium]|nr:NUDIX hydrolase [Oscillospiraceae bacterium]